MKTPASPVRPLRPSEILLRQYWRKNLVITLILLVGWAAFGLGAGIVFADSLNEWKLPGTGYPLGFWFAQQGSIVGFVVLILLYAIFMNRLDRQHHDELEVAEAAEAANHAKAEGPRA